MVRDGAAEAIAPGWVRPEDPALLALRAYAAGQARAFLDAHPRTADPVPAATRSLAEPAERLSGLLRVFAALVHAEWAHRLAAELRWITGVLAGERERQAVLARVGPVLDDLGDDDGGRRARHLIARRLARELSLLHDDAVSALSSPRYRTLADRLTVLGDDLPGTELADRPCREALPPPVLAAYRRLTQLVEQLGERSPEQDWQEALTAAERSRLAAELCGPVFGPAARAFGRQLGRVIEILDRHQDAVRCARVARAAASTPRIAPSTSFALGVLHASERAAAAAAFRDLGDVWPEVSGKRWRRWLTQA